MSSKFELAWVLEINVHKFTKIFLDFFEKFCYIEIMSIKVSKNKLVSVKEVMEDGKGACDRLAHRSFFVQVNLRSIDGEPLIVTFLAVVN